MGSYFDVVNSQKKTLHLSKNKKKEIHPDPKILPKHPKAKDSLFSQGRIINPSSAKDSMSFFDKINPFRKDGQ